MPSYDGRATTELVEALAAMPSSWAQSHLRFFIQALEQELEARNKHYRHTLLETFATELVEAMGGEVDWYPCTDSADAQEIAQKWYHMGHEDGEEGMAPEPWGHTREWSKL